MAVPRYWQCAIELNPYRPKTKLSEFEAQLKIFRERDLNTIVNGVQFRNLKIKTPRVLTLRIKRFFFDKILLGEKVFEFREEGQQNNKLLRRAIERRAKFLRLHFQDNQIQLLAIIKRIDLVPGVEAHEPWDLAQGIEPSDHLHWRIEIKQPTLIWQNAEALHYIEELKKK